jgi:hypothetical protein
MENQTGSEVKCEGYSCQLDDKRDMFVGQYRGTNDFFFKFTNKENVGSEVVQFKLSEEAAFALTDALTKIFAGDHRERAGL